MAPQQKNAKPGASKMQGILDVEVQPRKDPFAFPWEPKSRVANGLFNLEACLKHGTVASHIEKRQKTIKTGALDNREFTAQPPAPALPANLASFPLKSRPAAGYHEGGRRFGAPRDKRRHAGCDLLTSPGTAVLAIMDGEIIQGPYSFYSGTFALEVKFVNGMIGRYGEISSSAASGISNGAKVVRGQVVGYTIKNTKDGACMLHFELYSGNASGNLSTKMAPFKRRSDLLNPTLILDSAPLP